MLIAPALFFYILSPVFIYFISGVGKYYNNNLKQNIDALFIFSDEIETLTEEQRIKIRKAINDELIPQLVKEVKGLYIDSYVNRTKENRKENLLSSFETLLLFSVIWAILSLADFIGVIILHYTAIELDFIILDRITNPVNVILFALLFGILTILSDILAYYSINRLRKLMLITLPIVIFVDEEENKKRSNFIRALGQFPIEGLVGEKTLSRHSRRIDDIYQEQYFEPLSETLQVYARNQVAKEQAWRIYKPILDQHKVTAIQSAKIKDRFFDTPFYDIARGVFGYEHEVQSLKTDIEYVKNRLNLWDKISEEEHATALLFLFRSTEQLFKSILDRFHAQIEVYTNFSMVLQFLKEKGLIGEKDEIAFDSVRKKRNTLVHQSGRIVKIKKDEIETFLESLENVLLKMEDYFKKDSS